MKFKLPYWLEHFLIFLVGQLVVAVGAYLTKNVYGMDTAVWGGLISTATKALIDELRKIDPQADLPSSDTTPPPSA